MTSSPRCSWTDIDALGARWLHVVDLDGARDGQQVNRDIILRLAAMPAMQLQVGGGIARFERDSTRYCMPASTAW